MQTLRRLRLRIRDLVYRRIDEIIVARQLGGELGTTSGCVAVQTIDEENFPTLLDFVGRYKQQGCGSRSKILGHLESGYSGFLFLREGQLFGYCWWVGGTSATQRNHPALERYEICLNDDEVYGFDFYLEPLSRDGVTAAESMLRAHRKMYEQGYGRAYGFVEGGNIPARFLWHSLGWQDLRQYTCWQIFGLWQVVAGRVYFKNGKRLKLWLNR